MKPRKHAIQSNGTSFISRLPVFFSHPSDVSGVAKRRKGEKNKHSYSQEYHLFSQLAKHSTNIQQISTSHEDHKKFPIFDCNSFFMAYIALKGDRLSRVDQMYPKTWLSIKFSNLISLYTKNLPIELSLDPLCFSLWSLGYGFCVMISLVKSRNSG